MAVSSLVAASGGGKFNYQEFNSSTTWTAPAGCTSVNIFLVAGGGGGGGDGNVSQAGGGGGGGGTVLKRPLAVTPGTSYTVTIGG